jgi:hypothetical protein
VTRLGLLLACAAVAASVLASGCGGSDKPLTEKEQIAKAIHDFNVAFAHGDGKKACRLITDTYRQGIELGRGEPCEKVVKEEASPAGPEYQAVRALDKAKVVDIQIVEGVATGELTGDNVGEGVPAQAQKQNGRWLVSATGRGTL